MRLPRRSPIRRLACWPAGAAPHPAGWIRGRRCWSLRLGAAGDSHVLTHVCLSLDRLFGLDRVPRALLLQRRERGRWRDAAHWALGRFWLVELAQPTLARDLRLLWSRCEAAGRLPAWSLQQPAAHAGPAAAAALGWPLAPAPGQLSFDFELRTLRLAGAGQPVAALELRWFGRFGNNVTQLVNALALARRASLGAVHLPPHGFMKVPPAGVGAAPRLRCSADVEPGDPLARPRLRGFFFQERLFPALQTCGGAERRALAQEYLRPLLDPQLWQRPVPPDTLVVHLRGGDVFTAARRVNALYRQPPLAFYRHCVERAARAGLAAVRLVSEDRANPCVDALLEWLALQGLPAELQSGDLASDFATLLGARQLVASGSSLVGTAALLSDRLETLYTFGELAQDTDGNLIFPNRHAGDVRAWGVRHVSLLDLEQGYLAYRAWRNTPAQRALMLSYPGAALGEDPSSD